MSQYYNIRGLKVRVSDHEPNSALRGSSDVELYVKSADNRLLSIESQLEYICERRNLDIRDFSEVLNDWQDGTYGKDIFAKKSEENEENEADATCSDSLTELRITAMLSNNEKLKSSYLSRSAHHTEVKALSEKTGVSQSYIKKHFKIR